MLDRRVSRIALDLGLVVVVTGALDSRLSGLGMDVSASSPSPSAGIDDA
jgi:hypothetical protein